MTDRQTDRQTDGQTNARGKTICLTTLSGGDIIVAGKQRKVSALFGRLFFCFKTVPNKAPTSRCFAGTACFVPNK